MRYLALLPGLFLTLMTSSQADIFHYNNIVPGVNSAQFGGAYSALSADPSVLAFNPAGLAFVEENELSGSVQGYYQNNQNYKKAVGDADFSENSGGGFSPFMGSAFNTNKYLQGSVAGFSLYTTDSLNQEQNNLIENQAIGSRKIKRYSRIVHATAETAVKSAGLAKRWGTFSAGLALGLYTVNEIFQSYQNSEIIQINAANARSVALESYFQKISISALEPLLGVLYQVRPNLNVGLAIRKPLVLSEDYSSDFDSSQFALDEQDNVLTIEGRRGVQKEVLAVISKNQVSSFPWGVNVGVATVNNGGFTAAFELSYRSAVKSANTDFNRRQLLNVSLGGEYKISPKINLRSGFFTNNDARPKLSADLNNQDDHIDYRGMTLFAEYALDKSRYSFGVIDQFGKGKAQKLQSSDGSPAPLQEVNGNRLSLVIGISHILGDDKCAPSNKN